MVAIIIILGLVCNCLMLYQYNKNLKVYRKSVDDYISAVENFKKAIEEYKKALRDKNIIDPSKQ